MSATPALLTREALCDAMLLIPREHSDLPVTLALLLGADEGAKRLGKARGSHVLLICRPEYPPLVHDVRSPKHVDGIRRCLGLPVLGFRVCGELFMPAGNATP